LRIAGTAVGVWGSSGRGCPGPEFCHGEVLIYIGVALLVPCWVLHSLSLQRQSMTKTAMTEI